MHIELSWQDEEKKHQQLRTDCPKIAEVLLRSTVGVPQMTAEMKQAFEGRYAGTIGSFEQVVREAIDARVLTQVESGIPGLRIRLLAPIGVQPVF